MCGNLLWRKYPINLAKGKKERLAVDVTTTEAVRGEEEKVEVEFEADLQPPVEDQVVR